MIGPVSSLELTYCWYLNPDGTLLRDKSPIEFAVTFNFTTTVATTSLHIEIQPCLTKVPSYFTPGLFSLLINIFTLVEHNIPKNEQTASQHTRRPDLSTFFSNLELVNTSNTQNSNATPMPADMRALFITLSDAFRSMRSQGGGTLLDTLIESLEADAEAPPREVKGVSDAFLDGEYGHNMAASGCPLYRQRGKESIRFASCDMDTNCSPQELDRVPKKTIKKNDSCPICGNPFLDGILISLPSPLLPTDTDYRPISTRCPPTLPQRSRLRSRMHCAVAQAPCYMSAG